MIPIRRDSQSHVALLYMKMKSSPVTVEQLRAFSPHKFKLQYKLKNILDNLTNLGFASFSSGCYTITDKGLQALYLIVKEQKRKQSSD